MVLIRFTRVFRVVNEALQVQPIPAASDQCADSLCAARDKSLRIFFLFNCMLQIATGDAWYSGICRQIRVDAEGYPDGKIDKYASFFFSTYM